MNDDERFLISFKDLYCIARLFQSSFTHGGNPFQGCQFCRFPCHLIDDNGHCIEPAPNFDFIRQRLKELTGVNFSPVGKEAANLKKEKSPCLDNKDFSNPALKAEVYDFFKS